MITFFKSKYGIFAWVFLWGFQFVFFPSYHYHLKNIHAYSDDLSSHQHQGQPHSHEFEAFNKLINNHAPEPLQGEDPHHSDPFSGDHSADYEINLHKSTQKSKSPFKTAKNGVVQNNFIIAEPILFAYYFPDALPIENSRLSQGPKERSPPSFLI